MKRLKMEQETQKRGTGSEVEIRRGAKLIGHMNHGGAKHINHQPCESNRARVMSLGYSVSHEQRMGQNQVSEEVGGRRCFQTDFNTRKIKEAYGQPGDGSSQWFNLAAIFEIEGNFMMRTVTEIRSSWRVRSFAISIEATTWPIAGDGTNTNSAFSIMNVCFLSRWRSLEDSLKKMAHLKMNLVARSFVRTIRSWFSKIWMAMVELEILWQLLIRIFFFKISII